MRYYLENELIKAEFDSFGGELKSVIRKDSNREYMWYGNPKYWGRTSPVLFPIVGTLRNNTYRFKDKEYKMSSHGFARDMEHTLVSQTENEIWFELRQNAETLGKYPFEFVLNLGYRLEGDRLEVLWKVTNPSKDELLFSIGAHPAFLCPIHGEKSKAGYYLAFGGTDEIRHHGNKGGLAIKEDLRLKLTDGRVKITEEFFDRSTFMIEDKQTSLVAIEDPEGRRFIEVDFDTPLFAIWSSEGKNAPFICIEPWFGMCDWDGFEGSFEEKSYMQKLAGGEEFNASYGIRFIGV